LKKNEPQGADAQILSSEKRKRIAVRKVQLRERGKARVSVYIDLHRKRISIKGERDPLTRSGEWFRKEMKSGHNPNSGGEEKAHVRTDLGDPSPRPKENKKEHAWIRWKKNSRAH